LKNTAAGVKNLPGAVRLPASVMSATVSDTLSCFRILLEVLIYLQLSRMLVDLEGQSENRRCNKPGVLFCKQDIVVRISPLRTGTKHGINGLAGVIE
jgi:hypothetical protein